MNLEIDDSPSESDIQFLLSQLAEFNKKYIEVKTRVPLAIWCKNEKQEVIGGATGNTFGKWLEIKYLWVEESQRKNKVGTTIIQKIEEVAKARGCCYVFVDTYDFQAKPFYLKNGYTEAFVLSEYPLTGKRYYLTKNIC